MPHVPSPWHCIPLGSLLPQNPVSKNDCWTCGVRSTSGLHLMASYLNACAYFPSCCCCYCYGFLLLLLLRFFAAATVMVFCCYLKHLHRRIGWVEWCNVNFFLVPSSHFTQFKLSRTKRKELSQRNVHVLS